MSHIVTIRTAVRDPVALAAACRRLRLAEPVAGTAQLFSSQAKGLIINLPNWSYPIVVDPISGEVRYDNFAGSWGDEAQLHRLLQRYAVEKTLIEARRKGQTVLEQPLADGSVRLTIQAGGGA
jgi:hypothetical protein